MHQTYIVYFDIAAVVIMVITLASLLLRNLTHGAANRVYLTATILVTLTALAAIGREALNEVVMLSVAQESLADNHAVMARNAFDLVYYTLRSFTAPAYLVIIATVSDTTHLFNKNVAVKIMLWVPMISVALLILTNPFHHLVFSYSDLSIQPGPLISFMYVVALYYSVTGIIWLIRWRILFSQGEFLTLILLYPIVFIVVGFQYVNPELRLEMFVTSIAMLLVSAFAIHPETRHDLAVGAESLHAYREMCRRAFITDKHLCLVYAEIANMEQLRQLIGTGDMQEIILGVSQNLSATLERDDILYYLHGGLFCISPRNLDPQHALDIALNTHEEGKIRAAKRGNKPTVPKLRSCIVRVPEDISEFDSLMTFVRRFGHLVSESTVTTFDELSRRSDFELQMHLSRVIERAINQNAFEIHYQPIYHLKDGQFRSAEALVRLNDPEFGWVSPGLFIPEAEQNGLIVSIGTILLKKICAFLGRIDYQATGLQYVEANLSVDQCIRPELTSELTALLHKHGVEPARLNLEITETSAAFSQQAIETNMRALAQAGVSLSLDDYGTGYSNVTRMLDLPFSLVKIDQSFVSGLNDPNTRTVLESSIAMLKTIGKEVLVEGVETREQVETLTEMGADYIQGYYYARPMPENEFIEFISKHNNAAPEVGPIVPVNAE